jgi:pimeloyl-ACP methyl ester carboxylesterase
MTLFHVQRAGVQLTYDLRGSGPLVALVQGLGLPGRMWLELPEGLAERGYSVVTPDARGTGGSDVPPPPYHILDLAADLAAVIRTTGRGPALVVAVSMGGMVSQHLALRYPELVGGLVLGATTCGLPHGRLPSPRFAVKVLHSLVDRQRALPDLRRMMLAPGRFDADPSIFDEWDRAQQGMVMPWHGVVGHLTAVVRHGAGFSLPRISCPTMVLAGEGDQILPAENARIIARLIPGAELVILPGAGHAFPLEEPEVIPRAIERVSRRIWMDNAAQAWRLRPLQRAPGRRCGRQ